MKIGREDNEGHVRVRKRQKETRREYRRCICLISKTVGKAGL